MEIKVSVRNLVEFIFRSGDIDNRIMSGSESAMEEGSRIHRLIQKSMGENYAPEVLLRYIYRTEHYNVVIEGRADGIINENWQDDAILGIENKKNELNADLKELRFDQITIDEIKTVSRSLDHIKEAVKVHLAQAKVYAYIYATQKKLPMIRVRMTYVHSETLEKKYFFEEYTVQELSTWFEELMLSYRRWTDFEYEWRNQRQASIKSIEFPFPYREGQRDLCVYGYQTIKEKKKLFLQAPTGTGKTISTLFPAIKSMGEELTEKIFYLTAKTITRTVAEETLNLLRNNGLLLKSVTITAKDKICPLEQTECNPDKCPYAKGHYDRINDTIYEIITNENSADRDVILKYATQHIVCPFELSLDISLFVDAIICDYNYVFDPHASLKRYFADGVKGEYTFLIDEAHNLVDRGREMYSAVLYKDDFLKLRRSIKEAMETQAVTKVFKKPSLARRIIKDLERCNKELLALKKECKNCVILESVDAFAGLVESLGSAMDLYLDEEKEPSDIRKEVLEFYFEISHFLYIYEKLNEHYTIYCENTENDVFYIKLFCVNPRDNLKEAMAKGRSAILFSATFLPIQYHKELLGGEKDDYEAYAKSIFNSEKRGLFIANDVTSKYSRRNTLEYHRIASYIYEVTRARKGNYMVFFPSYAFLNEVFACYKDSFWDEEEVSCLLQQEGMNEEDREYFLKAFEKNRQVHCGEDALPDHKDQYQDVSKETLIAFCVLGGVFSEGIDLKEDLLIGAIVVGTGLPLKCNEREILKEHFDETGKNGFNYAYRYPGINKVLQAAGRVIRTEDDIGVVALLDERFLERQNMAMFPREWSNYEIVNNMNVTETMESFWGRMTKKAIEQNP